jgi:hypothetical protein
VLPEPEATSSRLRLHPVAVRRWPALDPARLRRRAYRLALNKTVVASGTWPRDVPPPLDLQMTLVRSGAQKSPT